MNQIEAEMQGYCVVQIILNLIILVSIVKTSE